MLYRLAHLSALVVFAASTAVAADLFQYSAKSESEAKNYCELTGTWPTSVDESQVCDGTLPGEMTFRGHFAFGVPSKPLLVALVKEKSSGNLSLYVDADRNDQLNAQDLATRVDAHSWTAKVQVASTTKQNGAQTDTNGNAYLLAFRTVGDRVEIANAGVMEGVVALGETQLKANIEDRNCNGVWTDSEDRLQIDLNNDNSFNPLRERFSCQGTITTQSKRCGLAFTEDGLALRLSLKPIEGTGSIAAKVKIKNEAATIESCQAVLASTDGIHVTLSSLQEPIEVPVGEYRIKSLRIAMKDDRKWFAVFAQETTLKPPPIKVGHGDSVDFELLGKLTLSAEITAGNLDEPQKGQVVIVPMLTSETGLYLSRCLVGKAVAQSDNTLTASVIQLGATEKKVSAIESTGFACGSFCPIVFSGKEFGAGKALIMLKFDSGPLAGMMSEAAGKLKAK